LTKGDWRLLNSLQSWLDKNIEELKESDIERFERALTLPLNAKVFPELQRVLNNYDPLAKATFRALMRLSKEWGSQLSKEDWVELLPEDRPQLEWQKELDAAILLQELERITEENQIIVPIEDKWFQLLVSSNA
jgi:hypothetical protein